MLNGGVACYLPYECADGWISCGALEPKFWQAFCRGTDREDLLEHQFAKPGSEGHAAVAEVFMTKTKAEWAAFNDEYDCCVEPVLDLDEAMSSDLVREREMVVELDQPELGPCASSACRSSSRERPATPRGQLPRWARTRARFSKPPVTSQAKWMRWSRLARPRS